MGVFAFASFLHDIGAEMVFSVWPIYVTHVLGASATVLGLIDGIGDAVVSFSGAIAGVVSDRYGKRKVFVWTGYAFGFLARIGYAFAPTWRWAIAFRIIDRSGKIRSAPRDAIISDLSTRGDRGTHFGILRSMDNLGAVVGILCAIGLARWMEYRTMFLLAAIPSLLASALVLSAVREKAASPTAVRPIRLSGLGRNLWLFIILSAVADLGAFSYSFLLLASHESGIADLSVPLLYLLYNAVAALWSLPAGELADSVGRKPVLLFSYACWAMTALLFILHNGAPLAVTLAFISYGLYKGGIDTVQKTMTAELAPKGHEASVLGGFSLILGAVSLPASVIAGVLWDRVGPTAPFFVALTLVACAMVLLPFVRERREVAS